MGEEVRGVPEAAAIGRGAAQPRDAGIGPYIAQQRRLRGISLDELATLTKIPRRSLERLEAGAFDHAPDGFARGFVRTVAAALGLDPDEAVMRLLGEPCDQDAEDRARRRSARRRLAAGVALALAGGVAAGGLWALGVALANAWRTPSPPEMVVRQDAVRALAQEQALRDGEPSSPAGQSGEEGR